MSSRIRARDLLDRRHPLSPLSDRVLITLSIFVVSILAATAVIQLSMKVTFVNAFYFIAMVTTTNGAPFPPSSPAITLFTSLWAYYAFILLATIIAFAFGPLVGHIIKEGAAYIHREEENMENQHLKKL